MSIPINPLKMFEEMANAFDPLTGIRNRLIRDGWTPEGAEQLIITTLRLNGAHKEDA